ncbi:hypothetical protein Patl1_07961 [Pistacia atlantica]|uniref:Uncharacterized protein n=1 Tax=Pistacia atlantica TaxID=434234 RepID=A0ACC1AIT4_9ROSI|nr:hypothetical protein Patl1_07961 [Pistacia atlantica]
MYNKVDSDMGIEDIDLVGNELAITPVKSEPKQMKLDKKHTSLGKRKADVTPLRKKKTRQLVVFNKHRVQNNPSLKMFSTMVNRLLPVKALYEKLKGNGGNVNEIDFMSPNSLSIADSTNATGTRTQRAQLLANRLASVKNENLIIVPYNPGFHWVLVAIDMKTLTVYYLDSLRGDIGSCFNFHSGILIHSAWKVSKKGLISLGPIQLGCVECGFYLMRYMRDIVENGLALLKNNFMGKEIYKDAEVDEVRAEWVMYVINFL